MVEQGIGLTKETFIKGVENDTVAGHVGFVQSFGMFGEAFGMKFDKIVQTKEPIITSIPRSTDLVSVAAGNVAGCRQVGYGYKNDKVFIEMEHPQQIHPEMEDVETGDYINIEGTPNINLRVKPEIPGGIRSLRREEKAIKNWDAHIHADGAVPAGNKIVGKAAGAGAVRTHRSHSCYAQSADSWEQLFVLGATELFRCLLIIGERLQIGTLLQRGIDEHVHIRRRWRRLRILIAQLVADLFFKAKDCREGGDGRIDVVLGIEEQQLGLRQIHLGKGQIQR